MCSCMWVVYDVRTMIVQRQYETFMLISVGRLLEVNLRRGDNIKRDCMVMV